MTSTIELVGSDCFGCGACVNACPQDAIFMQGNEEGFLFPSINTQLCTGCGICMQVCPALGASFAPKAMVPKCFAAFSNDKLAMESSSGGIFSVLAEAVLKAGGAICGAAFSKDWSVAHIIVSDTSGLQKLKVSKYLQSNIGMVFREIKDLLDSGKEVFFTGTPCQVAGLYGFLQKDYDALLTADIFCHGVPSPGVWDRYLKEITNNGFVSHINFRNKDAGWQDFCLTITMGEGAVTKTLSQKRANDMYMGGFLQNLYLRKSCGTCMFSKTPRTADISLGDFWGYDRVDKKHDARKGISAVLVNTPKGESFFEKVKDTMLFLRPVSLKSIVASNPVLKEPCKAHQNRANFFKDFIKLDKNSSVIALIEKHLGRRNVGILNFSSYSENNFGAVLVGYAMEKAVAQSGYFPYTINFIPRKNLFNKTTKDTFLDFRKKFMHLTGICTSKKELQSYINNLFDTVIIGSDQVVRHPWHQDFIYYLDWVNGKKALVSYAASFGTSQLGMEQHEKKYAEKCFRRFDAFSVREESGAAIMKNKFGMDVPVLPDPTLLLKAEEYQSIIDAENMKSTTHDYVAYYFLDADRDVLADFSGKYPLVNMYRNEDGGFRTVGEWLNIIKNAKYVITDSFHGAVFSIIFHKEFAVIGTKVRGNERIDTLMKMTGLNRFFLDGPLTESLFANNIDYDSVERKLEVRRAEGYEYLKYALAIPPSKKKLLYKRGESFFRLFRIFPVLKIVPRRNGFKVRLFGIIPLLKIKDDNVKLFNFLKIGKIRIW